MSKQAIPLLYLVGLALIITPASATLFLSTLVLTPPALPMSPGEKQTASTVLSIVPNGPTTFESNNGLQITTGLLQPSWVAQVMVNGLPAARIPARGDALFINGYLLSYPTSSTVSVNIQVQGTVPQTPGQNVILLDIVQFDNTGAVVPGSTITVTEPVSGTSPLVTILPATPAIQPLSSPTVTHSPGFSAFSSILAAAISGVILVATFRLRK